MKIGIIGSGTVGQALGAALAAAGHDVRLGTREPGKLAEWCGANAGTSACTAAEAAAHGEVVMNATAGDVSLAALAAAGAQNLKGKVLIDVANPLDFSNGMPPTLTIVNTDSLGEQIQRAYPETFVVKALNTINTAVMTAPKSVGGGDHHLFLCGDDAGAKEKVKGWLRDWFGWEHFVDLGGIANARGTEMYLALWIRLMVALGTPRFNVRIVK